ncbi:hypothetical protein B0H14DRAFT_3891139 [Mycena olivaceomarginata]|nr:hypothetical protein B0H14DRAFT_3891139 [Mycena olivaceomarginata]
MKFFSLVLSLGLLAAASPMLSSDTTEVVAVAGLTPTFVLGIITSSGPAGQLPTSSFVPLLDQLTDALNSASTQLSTNAPGDMSANDEDLANLINEILDDVNTGTALNKLVPKLGLDGLLIPVDAAISGLLTSLDASLVPSLLAALQLL